MDRLCIYAIYDSEKIVDSYIKNVLRELKKFVSKLIVICNFDAISSGKENIIADEIIYRENVGYDAGAYKDALMNLGDTVNCYDEIILTNDTYYAPIFPFEEMFSRMESCNCDFWGITRHPDGRTCDGWKFPTHIQSYFLCFRKSVIQNEIFGKYWKEMPYFHELEDVIHNFEIGINMRLSECGFRGMAYTDTFKDFNYLQFNENPYLCYPYKLIKDYHIPIIKRRALEFDSDGYPQALKALDYIRENTDYDMNILEKHLFRFALCSTGIPSFDFEGMSKFVQKYSNIYIYGNGKWGKNLAGYFKYKDWGYSGHLVTNPKKKDEKKIEEITVNAKLGIIIAINSKKIVNEIFDRLKHWVDETQIFMPINLR